MPKSSSFVDAVLDVEPGSKAIADAPESDRPFRVLILGDFTGRANRGVFEPEAARRPVPIDRDNFDVVIGKLRPALRIPVGGGSGCLELEFSSLDDFHPDALYDSCAWLRELPERAEKQAATPQPEPPPAAVPRNLSLDELLDGPGSVAAAHATPDAWSQLLHDLVAPHLAAPEPPAGLGAHAEQALAAGMRALLRHRALQELEGAWRALWYLVRHIETGPDLKLAILDISRAELAADLEAAREDLRNSRIWRTLVGETVRTPGADTWSVIAGNYAFAQDPDDLQLLARMGAVAREAGAPFLSAASPRLLEDPEGGAFPQVRALPHACWIGLAMPRWLLRLPYGAETSPIERFPFEEMDQPEHEAYLWGNPAFACACLLAQTFRTSGWEMEPGTERDLDELPLHLYRESGEAKVKPCAEVLMTEDTAEALLEHGIMPLVSFKDRDVVRVLRFQSIADPPAALCGPWD